MKKNDQIKLFTLKEAANNFKISLSTITRLIKENKIHAIKIGGGIRVSQAEIFRLLNLDKDNSKLTQNIPLNRVEYNSEKLLFHYIIPGINSMEAETLEAIIGEEINLKEIFEFLEEQKYEQISQLLKNILSEHRLDIKKSLILVFIEEAIQNLITKKQIILDLINSDHSLLILPIPHHLFFNFVDFLKYGQIINSEDKLAPHLEKFRDRIIDINELDPSALHKKFLETEIIIIDGLKTQKGYLIRRSIANLITQYLEKTKKIYIHNIPHLPKDQNFVLIQDTNILLKIINI